MKKKEKRKKKKEKGQQMFSQRSYSKLPVSLPVQKNELIVFLLFRCRFVLP